jgi:DHA2 family multidrug resistance protein
MLTRISLASEVVYLAQSTAVFGFGMGLVLVPIATESIRRIPAHLTGTGTGMFNLMRNEGGSVGIALCTTLLAQRSQFHYARLAEHVNAFNGVLQHQAVAMAAGLFPWAGLHPTAMPGLAAGLLGQGLIQQSYLMSFVDIFAFLAVTMFLSLPFAMLMRRFKGQ